MNVTLDRKIGMITIIQKYYMEHAVDRFGINDCNPAFTPGVGPEQLLNQPEKNPQDEKGKRRYQLIVGVIIYLTQVSRYDMFYRMNTLAQEMSRPSMDHMGDKPLPLYLAESTTFSSPSSW